MAEKAKKNNIIVGVCIVAVVVIAIVATIVAIMLKNSGTIIGNLDDSYFVSDGAKYVITLNGNEIYIEDEAYAPNKYHLVYTYSGDTITGLKSFYEYSDGTLAQKAYDYFIEQNIMNAEEIEVNNNYVIKTSSAQDYEGITATDVKQQIELIELTESIESKEDETEEVVEAETPAEPTEVSE